MPEECRDPRDFMVVGVNTRRHKCYSANKMTLDKMYQENEDVDFSSTSNRDLGFIHSFCVIILHQLKCLREKQGLIPIK